MTDQKLPEELITLAKDLIYCRDAQIKQLHLLLGASQWAPQLLVLHGVEGTGKTLVIQKLLPTVNKLYATIRCRDCLTTRHLLERTLAAVKESIAQSDQAPPPETSGRCENLATFVSDLQILLANRDRFILVFDNIDQQREPSATLYPALARLSETIPNLTTVLITHRATPHLYHTSTPLYLLFPPYPREEILTILSHSSHHLGTLSPSAKNSANEPLKYTYSEPDTHWLWTRYLGHLWDSLGASTTRSLPAFRTLAERLWQPFIQPILDGEFGIRGSQELPKLLIRHKSLLQSETALTASINPPPSTSQKQNSTWTLPLIPALLLTAAYLASTTHPKHDIRLFSRHSDGRKQRRRRTAPTSIAQAAQSRKIPRRLLPPSPFPLERGLAIMHAIAPHPIKGGQGDTLMQFATLASLRLVSRVGAVGDVLAEGGGKWRVGAGVTEEMVRGVARGVGVELGEYVVE